MLVIRFRRVGKKNSPTYRVVVTEHTQPVNGKFTADLGSYNPHTKATTLNKDEALAWMKKGAKPSNSVAKLLQKEKVKHASVVIIKKKRSPKKAAEEKVTETPVAEAVTETTPEPPAPEAAEPATEESAETPTEA